MSKKRTCPERMFKGSFDIGLPEMIFYDEYVLINKADCRHLIGYGKFNWDVFRDIMVKSWGIDLNSGSARDDNKETSNG